MTTPIIGSIQSIAAWHAEARPVVEEKGFNVQLGCHLEEVCEMLETLLISDHDTKERFVGESSMAYRFLKDLSDSLKKGELSAQIIDRKEFADSLGDQIVTAIGVGHTSKVDVPTICQRVDCSNWSKFKDGKAIFDENGKIAKNPDTYVKADLTGTY